MTPSFPHLRGPARLPALLVALLAAHVLSSVPAQAHPHHDTPPTVPSLVRVLPMEDERAALLVRHLHEGEATRTAEALQVGRPEAPDELSDHAHGRPAQLALGGTDLLLVLAAGLPEQLLQREALEAAILRTFTPGDRIALSLGTQASSFALSGDLDALLAFLAEAPAPPTDLPDAAAALDDALSLEAPDMLRTHRELMLVLPDTLPVGDLDAIARLLAAHEIPLHVLQLGAESTSRIEMLCAVARGSGGSCRSAQPEEADTALRTMMATTRSVFLTDFPCVAQPLPDPYPLLLQTGGGRTGPVATPSERLRCTQADPAELAEDVVEAATGEPPPERDLRPLWLGLILLALLAIFLVLGRLAAGTPPTPPRPQGGRPERPNLLELPRNSDAIALTSEAVSTDRPEWLRSPELASARDALRRTRPSLAEPHVCVATTNGEVRELPLREGALVLGEGSDLPLPIPAGLQVRIEARGEGWRFATESGTLLHEGAQRDGGVLRPGEELCVEGAFVLELRPGRPAETLRGHLRFAPAGIFADEAASTTGLLYGRDPQRYEGIDPRPASRVIGAISNDHLEVWRSGARLFARDLGSSNGTLRDGERLEAFRTVELQAGDRLELAGLITMEVS